MSRTTKLKLEKTKVKVVFRLQFHATHIPQSRWDKLFVSCIPADSGKATAKTTKANVRNGTCKWADPIYETTRLLQDVRTKIYEEKLYKLIVAMGSSQSSILGEANILGKANINLADYVTAYKPTVVTLPLQGSDAGADLNVTVQLLTSKTGFREFEQQRELSEKGLRTATNHDAEKMLMSPKHASSLMYKMNSRVKLKRELGEPPSLQEASLNDEFPDPAGGFDGTSNTSESLYAERNDASSMHENDSIKSMVSGDFGGLSLEQSPNSGKRSSPAGLFVTSGTSDWIHRWGSDPSMENELANVYEENSRLRGSLEVAELSINEMQLEMNTLRRYADDMGAQTNQLTEDVAAEIASGQELATEVSLLKSECETLKGDLESLRNPGTLDGTMQKESDAGLHQDDTQHQAYASWIKGLLVLEDKIRELQNKSYLSFRENEVQFLLSGLEALVGIVHDIRQGSPAPQLAMAPSGSADTEMTCENSLAVTDKFASGSGFGLDLCHPDDVLQCLSVPNLVSSGVNSSDTSAEKHEELFKLLRELDESKAEKEALTTKMDQMECYYEALIQELEENQKKVLGEYQNIRNEHSGCIYTISSTKEQMEVLHSSMKAQMEAMHQTMSEKIMKLEKERCELDSLNKELERRAATSEATLRRLKLNYSIAVDQLQKELDTLSSQVLSMYETNENIVKKAFAEALQPCFEGYPEASWSENDVKKDSNILEELRKSITSREQLYRESEEELYDISLANVQVDVFAQILQQTLREATAEIRLEKERLCMLMESLETSTKSNESLKTELQAAADGNSALTVDKALCIAKCNDLNLQIQTLEAKCRSVCEENHVLVQKTAEWQALALGFKSYKDRFEACDADRQKLASLFEHSTLENTNLNKENFSLQEELSAAKTELAELTSSKESLQRTVDYLQEKLGALSASYSEQFVYISLFDDSLALPDLASDNFTGIISWLEEVQHLSGKKIHQLVQEKRDLEDERNLAQFCVSNIKHELELMRQKFKHEIPDLVHRLDASIAIMGKLQKHLDDIDGRLKLRTEAEVKHAMNNEEFSSDLARMEAELRELTLKNGDLMQQILALGTISEELERSKFVLSELMCEKEDLSTSLKDKSEESILLVAELNNVKGALKSLNDELLAERGYRCSLERQFSELNSQLSEEHLKLRDFQQNTAEVVHLKQVLSNLEAENSTLLHQLSQVKESREQTLADSSQAEMRETEESLLAADVALDFLTMLCNCQFEELLQLFESKDRLLQDLNMKHLNLDTMFNQCAASEANYTKKNRQLSSTLESLKAELQISMAENKALVDSHTEEKSAQESEIKRLSFQLKCYHEEIDSLSFSNNELEIRFFVLKSKLDELCFMMDEELMKLQQQNNELNRGLQEQTLKAELFRNLSLHLKELKDQADADCLQARQKREAEGAAHESLRIAFIKEQYEGKLQELRHQLSISKKHGEEMLCKLQDAVDQLEKSKKSEASQMKRNDELSQRISVLEAELHSAVSDNREKANAYDQVKAELECSLISLECCKEEKQKLVDCLRGCNDEKSRIEAEFNSFRETLERSTGSMKSLEPEDGTSIGREVSAVTSVTSSPSKSCHTCLECRGSEKPLAGNGILTSVDSRTIRRSPFSQVALGSRGPQDPLGSRDDTDEVQENDVCHADNRLNAQSLKSRIDNLHNELERMKYENSADVDYAHPVEFNTDEGLQSELAQLEKVNKELRSISPIFDDLPSNGNAIERVLALELELADALQVKKKSTVPSQCSFLGQASDEVNVLKSFRDVNELIKDMLEMKARYNAMDVELKEMHERYSKLSLQYAEVEGERQKLMIMHKNGRSPKRFLSHSSASIPES